MPKATESITYSKRSNSQVLIFSFAFQVNPIYKLANVKGVSREKVLDKSGNLTKEKCTHAPLSPAKELGRNISLECWNAG